MIRPLTIECEVHFNMQAKGRKELHPGHATAPVVPGRVLRVAKLLALAHRFEQLLHEGIVKDYATLGRLGHLTRARVSQIMTLLCLAPDIQEEILYWPPTVRGKDRVQMRQVLPIAALPDWKKQRQRWLELRGRPLA